MLYEAIKKLVQYGISTGLTPESERVYTTNLLLDVMKEDNYEDVPCDLENINLEDVLAELLDEAVKRGIIGDSITYRDLLDTKLMNCLMPRPSQVQAEFWDKYKISPEAATDYYYKLSQDSDYIRRYRIKKDRKWTVDTEYGTLDITINLSKPETGQYDFLHLAVHPPCSVVLLRHAYRSGFETGNHLIESLYAYFHNSAIILDISCFVPSVASESGSLTRPVEIDGRLTFTGPVVCSGKKPDI